MVKGITSASFMCHTVATVGSSFLRSTEVMIPLSKTTLAASPGCLGAVTTVQDQKPPLDNLLSVSRLTFWPCHTRGEEMYLNSYWFKSRSSTSPSSYLMTAASLMNFW